MLDSSSLGCCCDLYIFQAPIASWSSCDWDLGIIRQVRQITVLPWITQDLFSYFQYRDDYERPRMFSKIVLTEIYHIHSASSRVTQTAWQQQPWKMAEVANAEVTFPHVEMASCQLKGKFIKQSHLENNGKNSLPGNRFAIFSGLTRKEETKHILVGWQRWWWCKTAFCNNLPYKPYCQFS